MYTEIIHDQNTPQKGKKKERKEKRKKGKRQCSFCGSVLGHISKQLSA
jgi:ribosomal protein S14